MTLSDMLTFLGCIIAAIFFTACLVPQDHWPWDFLTFPLGLCSAGMIAVLLGEISIRCGYSRLARTPNTILLRSLIIGAIPGIVVGLMFYDSSVRGIMLTIDAGWHSPFLQASLAGMSVALTLALFLLIHHQSEHRGQRRPSDQRR